jgi:hypothetical protein
MKIGKNGLREHLRLLSPLFGLIAGVWALRLIVAAANSPHWITRVTSVTTAVAVTVLLAVLLIHYKRFGGYASVVVAALLLNLWAQVLVVAAILFSYATGMQNVYSAPEYSLPGDELSHLKHVYAHLTFGAGIGSLVGAVFGCLLLALLRWQGPDPSKESAWMRKGT